MKKALSLILTLVLLVGVLPLTAAASDAGAEDAVQLIEGTYAPGQVIVLFKDSAIDVGTAPGKGDLAAVGADFGEMMEASFSLEDAYSAADEELKILKKSLGDDFVLEDTLVFGDGRNGGGLAPVGASADSGSDDFTLALVSSDRYDTAELIEKLSANKNVVKAEPNYYIYPASVDDYSLNDPLNRYLYDVNSPAANNTGGENVDSQGLDPGSAISINASSAWAKLSGDEDEVVVAVIDTGVYYDHEDLRDIMWTNPGDIGLRGEHGYDFINNDDDPLDDNHHGTHCAGIIAAQANNAKGVAGVASAANVRIMALKILSAEGSDYSDSTIFQSCGAYHYIHKAVQGGVNVVAVNNSWGGYDYGTIYDDLIDLLGEDGVITYNAASNDGTDNDLLMMSPGNSESDYAVSVGAVDIEGVRAEFSNYGKTSVDVFGPGVSVLSAVSEDVYSPNLYDADTLNATTEYYGEFGADTQVIDGTVTPSTGEKAGDDIKSFGSLRFIKHRYLAADDDYEIPDDARLALSVEDGSLKITLKNAQYGEYYYIYFPYEKNPLTTNDGNTAFSMTVRSVRSEDGSVVNAFGGDVVETENGYGMYQNGVFAGSSDAFYRNMRFIVTNAEEKDRLISAGEAEGKETGIGLALCPGWNEKGESHDATFYLDSIAVSKPGIELEPGTSYDFLSGTSMATPAVCGAGALLASLYPRQEGESGSDYAKRIRAKLFSCVRQTEELKELCSTGGYVDLSLLETGEPAIIDAVCDLGNEAIILTGENLYEGSTVTYRRLAVDGAQDQPLPQEMTVEYAADGTKAVIRNAKSLFSTYLEFNVTAQNGLRGTGKFFLVKGQNKLDVVQAYRDFGSVEYPYLLTDADGRNLYGYYNTTGEVSCFDGEQFNTYMSTNMYDALGKHYIDCGADTYTVYNDYIMTAFLKDVPTCEDGVIYNLMIVYIPDEDNADGDEPTEPEDEPEPAESEEDEEDEEDFNYREEFFLAVFDLNGTDHRWHFTEISALPEGLRLDDGAFGLATAFYNGKFICIGDPGTAGSTDVSLPVYSYDLTADEWTEEPDLPYVAVCYDIAQSNGKLYVMFGFDPDRSKSNEERLLSEVWCFDGEKWEQKRDDLRYVGRINDNEGTLYHSDAITPVRNGLIFFNASVDGGGNLFLYNTYTDEIEPLYYSAFDGLCDAQDQNHSCVATRDGIYYIYMFTEIGGDSIGWNLCFMPADSGLYEDPYADYIRGDADGDGEVTILDATAIQRCLVGIRAASFNEKAADVDGDGEVTILDATAIQRLLAGLPSAFDPPTPDYDALYKRAVRDAMIIEEDDIMPLVNITKDDDRVIWDGDRVLVAFMHKYPDSYPAGEDITLKWGNVWCVSAGEMIDWVNDNAKDVDDWSFRLHQLLGMPASKGYTTITAVWVDADLLYRPANVTDPTAEMKTAYQPTGDKEFDTMYKLWFDSNIIWSYFDSAYPWTRLGYTYDWADNGTAYGLSEFLIFSGADATVEYTMSIDDFVAYEMQR